MLTASIANEDKKLKKQNAFALQTLSNAQSEMGQREEAPEKARESLAIYRQLANENPNVFNSDLARSLHNLSVRLSKMGFRQEALQAIRDAVDIFKQLAEENPNAFNKYLASSLHDLSVRLSEMGFRQEALQAIRDAVNMYNQLAEENPNVFNSDLAGSLSNLAIGFQRWALDKKHCRPAGMLWTFASSLLRRTPMHSIWVWQCLFVISQLCYQI